MQQLILASSSLYRQQLLAKLKLPFTAISADIDETPQAGEQASELVLRLAQGKAEAVSQQYPNALIIGSDQVATIKSDKHSTPSSHGPAILTKPLNYPQANHQLQMSSGRRVTFYTGLCLLNTHTSTKHVLIDQFEVKFKNLSAEQIAGYLTKEEPYDCAGSFKCEGLGIALFEELIGTDPNTLVGLPLIRLVALLQREGIDPLTSTASFNE